MAPRFLPMLLLIMTASLAFGADELAEKWQKRIADADSAFASSVAKADKTRLTAVQRANADRVKVLKTALAEATKSGDFNAGTILKQKLNAAEAEGKTTPKPKNIVKFGGHEYAFIEEKAVWNTAKRRCEEMGGHLAVLNTEAEAAWVAELIRTAKQTAWVGASDEENEGQWVWLTGEPVGAYITSNSQFDNSGEEGQHYLCITGDHWDDAGNSRRAYVCEWDN